MYHCSPENSTFMTVCLLTLFFEDTCRDECTFGELVPKRTAFFNSATKPMIKQDQFSI